MKKEVLDKVKEVVAAPSCFGALKELGEKAIAADGTPEEADAMKAFMTELEKDVQPIGDSLAFFKSDMGKEIFGDQVDGMIEAYEKAQAEGEDTCLCPACQAGKALLAMKGELV